MNGVVRAQAMQIRQPGSFKCECVGELDLDVLGPIRLEVLGKTSMVGRLELAGATPSCERRAGLDERDQ